MSRVETEEIPEFPIGRVMLTAGELAGLAECEAAARCGTLEVEDSQREENLPTIFYAGKKPTRLRFVLRHNTKPDTETGTQILTRMPHNRRGSYGRSYPRRSNTHILTWRVRAPLISDWDTSE